MDVKSIFKAWVADVDKRYDENKEIINNLHNAAVEYSDDIDELLEIIGGGVNE